MTLAQEIERELKNRGLRNAVCGAIEDGDSGEVILWGAGGRAVWSVAEAVTTALERSVDKEEA